LASLLPSDPVVHYNLACSLALVGEQREGVARLRRALELGYSDFEYLACDSDLDNLRDDPAYEALVREYEIHKPDDE